MGWSSTSGATNMHGRKFTASCSKYTRYAIEIPRNKRNEHKDGSYMQCHSEALSDVDYIHAGAELTCELLLGAVERAYINIWWIPFSWHEAELA
jgi:hypothetical protein